MSSSSQPTKIDDFDGDSGGDGVGLTTTTTTTTTLSTGPPEPELSELLASVPSRRMGSGVLMDFGAGLDWGGEEGDGEDG